MATFSDVDEDYWAYHYIEAIYAAGITIGCATTPLRFCPTDAVTWAEMAAFLTRALKHNGDIDDDRDASAPSLWTDITQDHWAYGYVGKATRLGIFGGAERDELATGEYGHTASITRGQMACVLTRAMNIDLITPTTARFSDVTTSHRFFSHIETLAARDIVKGTSSTNFSPSSTLQRDQMAKVIVLGFSIPYVTGGAGEAGTG